MVEYDNGKLNFFEEYGSYYYKCTSLPSLKIRDMAASNKICLKYVVTFVFYYIISSYNAMDAVQLIINLDNKRLSLKRSIDTDWTLDYFFNLMKTDCHSVTEYNEETIKGPLTSFITDDVNIYNKHSCDLIVYLKDINGEVNINVYFNKAVYERYMIKSIMDSFNVFLSEAELEKQIKSIRILTCEEYDRIFDLNCRKEEKGKIKYNPNWLSFSAAKYGNKVALLTDKSKVTYHELYEKVKRIALSIVRKGMKENDVIAILMPRTIELVISILAVLHAGAICTVIDKDFPVKRAQSMLKMSGAKFLLVRNEEDDIWSPYTTVLYYERLSESGEIDTINRQKQPGIGFIVFTSGSTGYPNGIELNQAGIFNHIQTKIIEGRLTEEDVFCFNLGVSFVASIWLVLTPLMLGGTLYIMDDSDNKDPGVFFNKIKRNRITILELIPSYLNTYLQNFRVDDLNQSSLRLIFLTGEILHKSVVKRFYSSSRIQLINAYGQSECSDDTLHYHVPYNIDSKYIPIGLPAIKTRVYILNQHLQLLPPGFAGDIYIAGEGIAKYCDGREITLKLLKYGDLEDRVYKTGDIGFWDMAGNIVFLGRKDRMVKVNGCRFDLQELENAALQLQSVQQAAVIIHNDKRLILFVSSLLNLDETRILNDISDELPAYMVPDKVCVVKSLPVNKNGKIDYEKLHVQASNTAIKLKHENILADNVLQIYESLFKKHINLEDNLLVHTTDSLMFAVFVSKVNNEFHVQLSLEEIIDNPTINSICDFISEKNNNI